MQAYCLALPGAWPDNPWDPDHPVIKVGPGERGKIFAFLGAGRRGRQEWSQPGGGRRVAAAVPGDATVMAYIGRSGWNDLTFGGAIPDEDLLDAVDESYRLVVEGCPRSCAARRRGPRGQSFPA